MDLLYIFVHRSSHVPFANFNLKINIHVFVNMAKLNLSSFVSEFELCSSIVHRECD